MLPEKISAAIDHLSEIERSGLEASQALHAAVLSGGEPARKLADLLHGVWLGHPLHPVLTDLTIGAWTAGAIFDALAAVTDSDTARRVADAVLTLGTASAIPTALAGMADYSGAPKKALAPATLHAFANEISVVLYFFSLRDRRKGRRGRGVLLSTAAFALSGFSAWLGGHLVYRHRVGVDNSARPELPAAWTRVAALDDVADGATHCADYNGARLLLYREGEAVYALDAVCSHAGGPLEAGQVHDGKVTCPWHDSVFNLRDGCVVHGPATHPQQRYEARIAGGQIEVRQPA